jgi:signal recognition particle GTPase
MIKTGHTLVIGKTMSGKTTLVSRIADNFKKAGCGLIVLTPFTKDDRWASADYVTEDADDFCKVVFASRQCLVIVDEGSEYAGKYDDTVFKIATRGRHYGHLAIFIGQKYKDLNKAIRENCVNLFVFKSSPQQCAELSETYVNESINEAIKLDYYQFIAVIHRVGTFRGNTENWRLDKISDVC